MPQDARVDAYIERCAPFAQPILAWLRARVHAALPGAGEGVKWGMPFFLVDGRNFANMAGFKGHVSFGFWNRAENETGREGEAMGQFGRIARLEDLPDAAAFEAIVRQAAARGLTKAAAPRRPRAEGEEAELPAALAEALARDDLAAEQFAAMPPGARRDYADWIGEAKREATRDKRVAQAVEWIREGKRRNWKYER
jgi:uncharacterized protein YdeI (YjbR/CyaY-like superfamily)